MNLFDKLKKNKIISNKDIEIEKNIKKNCATAINYAKSFEKNFDYSNYCIKDLEEILNYYSNDISKSNPTESQIWNMALIFGSYLGETMLRNGLKKNGYNWGITNNSNIPLLITTAGNYITPIDKVYKRLINGKEDSIISFYDFLIDYK